MGISSISSTQHVVTRCNKVAKYTQHVAPNDVAICCDRLAGSCKYWANNAVLKCCDRWPGLYILFFQLFY